MKRARPYGALFAGLYDRLMDEGVDYAQWVRYLRRLLQEHGVAEGSLIDVGCGTGNITLPLARAGYRLTGLDRSRSMLRIARRKAERETARVDWVWGDVRALPRRLPGSPYRAAICACDGFNYLLSRRQLARALAGLWRHLRPGGILLFDLNTRYKLGCIYGNHTFRRDQPRFSYVWENRYIRSAGLVRMTLAFRVRLPGRPPREGREIHRQKAFPPNEVAAALRTGGFELLAAHAFPTVHPAGPRTQRVQYVARRCKV